MTPIDLDELERKARLCFAASADPWETETIDTRGRMPDYCSAFAIVKTDNEEQIADAYTDTPWGDRQCLDHAAHIAANSPPVTIALVARIRELEAGLREACQQAARGPMWGSDVKRLRAVAEKGTVRR